MHCPKCDVDISDSYEPDDPSVGICGGWYCDACDLAIGEHEVEREPLPDDVPISFHVPGKELGTPISQLSGQPGMPGGRFKAIAGSWGYD